LFEQDGVQLWGATGAVARHAPHCGHYLVGGRVFYYVTRHSSADAAQESLLVAIHADQEDSCIGNDTANRLDKVKSRTRINAGVHRKYPGAQLTDTLVGSGIEGDRCHDSDVVLAVEYSRESFP
jgi:hypothetical protein